ncbi:uncharacterized protein LOC126968490 [Leptidea sinapis]|uniref:uncharacterized protein LOC126968490 n=1 Tax=Leptidea sinapis TaxID=189913 RepID=UPI002146E1FE|nr:uncharacterized protein LOC126968490 [Leptidea sinapis]XP_050669523.1 uncharacterized protein LOC126968490 [Leptidea sinapis]
MAPVKFGLFKARSRDQQDQPSTENLLKSSGSIDQAGAPSSPIPSTSRGIVEAISPHDFSFLTLDDDDDDDYDDDEVVPPKDISRKNSQQSLCEDPLVNYQQLQNSSITSTSTLELDQINIYDDPETFVDESSTAFDANSSQFDVTSLQFDEEYDTTSISAEDWSLYCSMIKKPKRKHKEQQLSDIDMWRASNVEVMKNLLHRSGTLDEQIKWEAIATSRGLCTLTDTCTCSDCSGAKYLVGIADGDGGLGSAPLFSAIGVGCQIQ